MTTRKSSKPDMGTAERLEARGRNEPMHEAREAEYEHVERKATDDYVYKPPLNLEAPDPRPGYIQRWVRAELRSESDNLNWQSKLREGWRPRDPKSVRQEDYFFGQESKSGQDLIKVGGLVLMEIPEEKLAAKRRAIDENSRRQELSVSMDTDKASAVGVAQGHSPIQREHTTTASTGRRPPSLAD